MEQNDWSKVLDIILQTEGLVEHQTPARITNEQMRNWNTYLGYPIKKDNIQHERRNFIHLQNKEDVPKAITAQMKRYTVDSPRWGLPENPTLADAFRLYDQERPELKIAEAEKAGIDPSRPLKSFFEEVAATPTTAPQRANAQEATAQ